MKKIVFCLFIVLCCSKESLAQMEIDFIITVNGKLEVGSLSNLRFVIKSEGGAKKRVEIQYHPGSLFISELAYQQLFSNESDAVFIAFDHNKFCGKKHILTNYELPFYNSWLEHSFLILHAYDLSTGEYKNVFEPLSKEKNYTYELEYPGGSMKRVMINKMRKKRCK